MGSQWKRIVAFVTVAYAAISIVAMVSYWGSTGKDHGRQSLVIAPSLVDLGDVRVDQQTSTEFTIYNNSCEPVSVENLILTCGCMSTDFEPVILPSGASSRFKITLKRNSSGPGEQKGVLKTDLDPLEAPEFTLRYNVIVDAYYIQPQRNVGILWVNLESWPLRLEFEMAGDPKYSSNIQRVSLDASPSMPLEFELHADSRIGDKERVVLLATPVPGTSGGPFGQKVRLLVECEEGEYSYTFFLNGILATDDL
jgi:hypothetical protein